MRFEAFECKFEPFERDSKHPNSNLNDSKGIQSIRMQIQTIQNGFEAFECKFEPFEKDSSIRMQIRTIRKGFKAFECKFERDSKY